jgi:hypothetical protein
VWDTADIAPLTNPNLVVKAIVDEGDPIDVVSKVLDGESVFGALPHEVLLNLVGGSPLDLYGHLIHTDQGPFSHLRIEVEVDASLGQRAVRVEVTFGCERSPRIATPIHQVQGLRRIPVGLRRDGALLCLQATRSGEPAGCDEKSK